MLQIYLQESALLFDARRPILIHVQQQLAINSPKDTPFNVLSHLMLQERIVRTLFSINGTGEAVLISESQTPLLLLNPQCQNLLSLRSQCKRKLLTSMQAWPRTLNY